MALEYLQQDLSFCLYSEHLVSTFVSLIHRYPNFWIPASKFNRQSSLIFLPVLPNPSKIYSLSSLCLYLLRICSSSRSAAVLTSQLKYCGGIRIYSLLFAHSGITNSSSYPPILIFTLGIFPVCVDVDLSRKSSTQKIIGVLWDSVSRRELHGICGGLLLHIKGIVIFCSDSKSSQVIHLGEHYKEIDDEFFWNISYYGCRSMVIW